MKFPSARVLKQTTIKTKFNFQINPDNDRKPWDEIEVLSRWMADRVTAVQLAQKVAQLFNAEVRLTEGNYPYTTSGAYFHHSRN